MSVFANAAGLLQGLAAGAGAGLLSAPHCAAMCGPLAGAVCQGGGSGRSVPRSLRYQLGRFAGYTFAGTLAGQAGEAVAAPLARLLPWWLFPGLVALAFALWGVRVLRARRTPPAAVPSERLVALGRRPRLFALLLRLLPREPLALGLASVLLPCGALGAALALAALSGSAQRGGSVMLGFALSSGLAVLGAGWLLRRAASMRGVWLSRVAALLLFGAAIATLARPILAHASAPPSSLQSHRACH